jgi:hypothetical protein
MGKLGNVRVDAKQKLVYAQGGARWEGVNRETHKFGLACVGAMFDGIGVGGYTLGGGFGFLTGKRAIKIYIYIYVQYNIFDSEKAFFFVYICDIDMFAFSSYYRRKTWIGDG